jgi:acyl-CoA thioesterase-2
MADIWSDLLSCLELRALTPESAREGAVETADLGLGQQSSATHVFEGQNQNLEYHRLFGGQLLGQFVEAARRAAPEKSIKSIHCIFSKEGRADDPVQYDVVRQHEGRSFASLLITAHQPRGVIASAAVSLHVPEDGPQYQAIPAPGPVLTDDHRVQYSLIPWETRATGSLDSDAASPPEFEFWMRTPHVDPELAPALTAYATDLNVIGTALLQIEGYNQRGNGTAFNSAVTSHTIWFHRLFRCDEWLLLRQHSPIVAGSRSFGRGDILTEGGELVASFAQEALLRIKP